MKKLVFILTIVLFISCEGPQGIPGQDGGLIAARSFEIGLNFNAANNYEVVTPYGFNVLQSDVTLVYILWETPGQDVWRLLPQNVIFNDGSELKYNFDFTQSDVKIFLDGNTNFSTLNNNWTQNQFFRVVVLPVDDVDATNTSDLNAVINKFNISSFEKR